MSPRNRRGSQLAIELPPELLQRLKAYGAAQDRSVAALVRRWIEQGLGGEGIPTTTSAPGGEALERRVTALEADVRALKQQLRPSPRPLDPEPLAAAPALVPPSPVAEASRPALPAGRLTPDQAQGLLTNRQVCDALGLSAESSLTNWISRNGHEVAVGKSWKGFRLMGKGLLPEARTPGWLWERCDG